MRRDKKRVIGRAELIHAALHKPVLLGNGHTAETIDDIDTVSVALLTLGRLR